VGCDEVILLDTHAAIWMANDDPKLGRISRSRAEAARADHQLTISPISFWEVALLAVKGRLRLHQTAATLRDEMLGAGVGELSLTGDIGILAAELDLHGDPADRLIVATAIVHDATLMTADRTLLRWRHKLPRQDASK
jgi:PIN domain nuclease of toxin-antitoxin system